MHLPPLPVTSLASSIASAYDMASALDARSAGHAVGPVRPVVPVRPRNTPPLRYPVAHTSTALRRLVEEWLGARAAHGAAGAAVPVDRPSGPTALDPAFMRPRMQGTPVAPPPRRDNARHAFLLALRRADSARGRAADLS